MHHCREKLFITVQHKETWKRESEKEGYKDRDRDRECEKEKGREIKEESTCEYQHAKEKE